MARWQRAAAVLGLFAAGWMANEMTGDLSAPAHAASIVDEAHASHAVSSARRGIVSVPEADRLDRQELIKTTGLDLPDLPAGWRVNDVQLYPSHLGNSLTVMLTTDAGERLSLFAARTETPAEGIPMIERREGTAIAYWEKGPLAYALVGELDTPHLLRYAGKLSGAGGE